MAEVELSASLMGTRAFLTQNKDAEAFQMAQQCLEVARKSFTTAGAEDQRWQGIVLSHSIAALVQHAASDVESAGESFDEVLSLVDHVDPRNNSGGGAPPPAPRPRDYLIPQALKQVASFKLAQRETCDAKVLAARALEAAEKAATAAKQPSQSDPMLPLSPCLETVADCRLLQAQVCIDEKDWDGAEARISDALSAVELLTGGSGSGSSGVKHVRVAVVLLPLAWVYSRSGRVTLAEGLYREIAKILHLSPPPTTAGGGSGSGSGSNGGSLDFVEHLGVHPNVAALAAWRYAQLLTALPRRETEAQGWHRLAKDLYDDAPLRRVLEPASAFGTLDMLTGKGTSGYGVVLDLLTRRVLPRTPPPAPVPQSKTSPPDGPGLEEEGKTYCV